MIIKHKKGKHNSLPSSLFQFGFISSLEESYCFLNESKYILNDEDQRDWNKLTGIALDIFNSKGNSLMIAWRYNPNSDLFEVAPYLHNLDGGQSLSMFEPVLTVKENEIFSIAITAKKSEWYCRINDKNDFINKGSRKKIGRKISSWFGGNNPAPHDILIKKM